MNDENKKIEFIDFTRGGNPVQVHHKCLRCSETCKQSAAVNIVKCPNFRLIKD